MSSTKAPDPANETPGGEEASGRPLRVGIMGAASIAAEGIAVGLSEVLGETCELVKVDAYPALVEGLRTRSLDLAWLPPLAVIRAQAEGAAQLLATIERGGAVSYGGALLGRAGVGPSLGGVRGRRVVWTDAWSASGYIVPRARLRLGGVDPATAFASEVFVGSTRAVLEALRSGTADVGAAHCTLTPENTIKTAPWSEADGLDVLATFGPIPCDAICAGPSIGPEKRRAMREALRHPPAILLAALEATGLREPDARWYELFELAYLGEEAVAQSGTP
jgi:ABC-type phosphate/phosphonate transport system substrate-binding protein